MISILPQAYPKMTVASSARKASVSLLFGGQTSSTPLSPDQQRRIDLYLGFLKTPIPQAPPKIDYSRERGGHGMWGMQEEMLGRYDDDSYSPETIKAQLADRTLIELPKNFQPKFPRRKRIRAPYALPNLRELSRLRQGKTLSINIPPLKAENLKVRPPKVSPYMDMTPGSVSAKMVKAGLQPSEIAEEYQANWSAEKVSRDILQNFFDSHGQTLEGVRIDIQRLSDLKGVPNYRVQIFGQGQYDYEKAFVLGASDKQGDDDNAGGYGEGLKIIALNLLRDYQAEFVKVSSANWAMSYTLPKNQEADGHTPKLFNHLEHLAQPAEQPKGNYFEFATTSPEFIEKLVKATNYFYHPYHPDFQEQSYENQVGGFKLLPSGQKGNAYIALQRYEYQRKGAWDNNLPELTIWKRTKSEKAKVDRDRTHLSESEVETVLRAIIDKMPAQEVVHTLWALEPYWKRNTPGSLKRTMTDRLTLRLKNEHKAKMVFPPKYLAGNLSSISQDLKGYTYKEEEWLAKKGFIVCSEEFGSIGMRLASDVLAEIKPAAFKPKEEEKVEATVVDEAEDAAKNQISLSPEATLRFHVLSACLESILKNLSAHFSSGEIKKAKLMLGKHQEFRMEHNFKTYEFDYIFQISPEMLENKSLEQTLLQIIQPSLEDRCYSTTNPARLTYKLTELSMELARMFLASQSMRSSYGDLKAVWDLSWHPADSLSKQFQEVRIA